MGGKAESASMFTSFEAHGCRDDYVIQKKANFAFFLVSRKIERLVCEMLFIKELSPSLSTQADPTHAKLFVLTIYLTLPLVPSN